MPTINEFEKTRYIGLAYRCYANPLDKTGYIGIGRITDIWSFNGTYVGCRVRLISQIPRFHPNIDCWIDISEASPDKVKL